MSKRRTPLARWLSSTGTTVQSFAEKFKEASGMPVRVQPIYRWVSGASVPNGQSRRHIAEATAGAVPESAWPPSKQGKRSDLASKKKRRAA